MNPSILFRLPDGDFPVDAVTWKGLSDSDLETLMQDAENARIALIDELETRQSFAARVLPAKVKEYGEKIEKCLQTVNDLGHLLKRQDCLARSAADQLKTEPATYGARIYKEFLLDITRQSGRGVALLCAAGLGKNNVANLTTNERARLVKYIRSRKSVLNGPVLERLAEYYTFPVLEGLFTMRRLRL